MQKIIVSCIILTAIIFLVRKFYITFFGKKEGCDKCG